VASLAALVPPLRAAQRLLPVPHPFRPGALLSPVPAARRRPGALRAVAATAPAPMPAARRRSGEAAGY